MNACSFRENHQTIVGRHPPGTGLVLIISRRSARACCEDAPLTSATYAEPQTLPSSTKRSRADSFRTRIPSASTLGCGTRVTAATTKSLASSRMQNTRTHVALRMPLSFSHYSKQHLETLSVGGSVPSSCTLGASRKTSSQLSARHLPM